MAGRYRWRDGLEPVDFGSPAGELPAHYTIHSEPFTFWYTWKDRGLRTATWKLALPEEFTGQMRFLATLGLTGTEEIELAGGARVRPRDVLLACAARIPRPSGDTVLDDVDYLLGVVRGRKDGGRSSGAYGRSCRPTKRTEPAAATSTRASPGDRREDAGRGDIVGPGVFVPEQIVPVERFFAEFARWGVTIDAQMREIVAAPTA